MVPTTRRLRTWRFPAGAVVGLLALFSSLAGCTGAPVVVSGPPSARPYDGPLIVDAGTPPAEGSTGAAGLVVVCDHPESMTGWVSPTPYQGDVARQPETALKRDLMVLRGATNGYRVMREEGDRVLYVREFDAVVKQATIVHRGPAVDGRTGWYVESWARCNFSELPPEYGESAGYQIWVDAKGSRVPTTKIHSSAGPEHCDWEDMTSLAIDSGQLHGGRSYVRNLHEELREYASGPYLQGVPLPDDARPTTYQFNGDRLWFSQDGLRAYVGSSDSVDVWPKLIKSLGCA